jgi:hypothetical protein
MAKRKKKILFDVFGGGTSTYDDERPRERAQTRGPATGRRLSDELRMTRSFAGVLGLVSVAFVALSYYLGTIHGTSRADNAAKPQLQVSDSAGRTAASPTVSANRYSVMARSIEYTRFSRDEIVKDLRACKTFLIDQGYKPVEIFESPAKKKDGSGRLNLWVGSGTSKEDLDAAVKKLRGLRFQKKQMFATAVALEAPREG